MKPLVLSHDPRSEFVQDGFADLALSLRLFRFSWGPQPSQDELADHLGARTSSHDGLGAKHWSDWSVGSSKGSENRRYRDLSLADFCQHYETIELWFDVRPESQLQLVWLLDYFRAYPEVVARLKMRLIEIDMMELHELGNWRPHLVDVTEKKLATAGAAWQAYRSPTPEACFDLLRRDLSALPSLKPALLDLLKELPSASTGLGASEMRMLELIATGYANVNPLFHYQQLRQTRVFSEWEYGYLLDGLAFGPRPAITGLDEELRTIPWDKIGARHKPMLRSRLSLTDFGKAVLAHKEDFSRHNPIDRWWGGTHLTNDNLWRWNPALVKP
jgi:hypothetical protein